MRAPFFAVLLLLPAGVQAQTTATTTLTLQEAIERASAEANGADFVRFLPRNATAPDGRLGGNLVFARDFNGRNTLLRERFGARAWYRARIEPLTH